MLKVLRVLTGLWRVKGLRGLRDVIRMRASDPNWLIRSLHPHRSLISLWLRV